MNFRKSKEQIGLFDFIERVQELSSRAGSLDKLNDLIDFEVFRSELLEILDYGTHQKGGRPPWDPVLMLKVLIIQRYYNLSEEETEFQILDRFSFQRFVGLSVGDAVPDKNTIWDFKQRLGPQGMKRLFELFGVLLSEQGLVGKGGKIVDASFVDAPRRRVGKEKGETLSGKAPSHVDEDARWAKKGDETHFGYKNHAKCDAASKLVEAYEVTSAEVHDSNALEDLLGEDDQSLYADSAYKSAAIDQVLRERNIKNIIHQKGYRNHPLTDF
jgi:IS5 family transposase